MLDACRNNPFARSFRFRNRGLAIMTAPTGSFVAFATAPGSVAADGDGRNGIFTQHLLKHIKTTGLKIEEVLKRTRNDVLQATAKKQTPWQSSSLTGDFYFVPGTKAANVPSPDSSISSLDAERLKLQEELRRIEEEKRLMKEIERLAEERHKLEKEKEQMKTTSLTPNIQQLSVEPGKRTYDKALRLFNIKRFNESLRLFKSLDNRRTPENYRDNVVFWRGQCHLMMEDYEKAIEKFNVIIDDYGGGNKVTDSMYTIGVAYNALGEKSKALDYMELALNNEPSAHFRRKIKEKIREIKGK